MNVYVCVRKFILSITISSVEDQVIPCCSSSSSLWPHQYHYYCFQVWNLSLRLPVDSCKLQQHLLQWSCWPQFLHLYAATAVIRVSYWLTNCAFIRPYKHTARTERIAASHFKCLTHYSLREMLKSESCLLSLWQLNYCFLCCCFLLSFILLAFSPASASSCQLFPCFNACICAASCVFFTLKEALLNTKRAQLLH